MMAKMIILKRERKEGDVKEKHKEWIVSRKHVQVCWAPTTDSQALQ